MKNLLLLLVLANVLYFLWGLYQEDEPPVGTAVIDEAELGPPIEVIASRDGANSTSVGAVLGSGSAADLTAVMGRSCVTIGPFTDQNAADSADLNFSRQGMKTSVRSTRAEMFVGHWVQIRDIADTATANRMLNTLTEGGLTDARVFFSRNRCPLLPDMPGIRFRILQNRFGTGHNHPVTLYSQARSSRNNR